MQTSAGSSSNDENNNNKNSSSASTATTAARSATAPTTSSDKMIPQVMQKGLEQVVIQTGAGLILGGLVGIVLARGGASGARKAFAGLGAGVGLGSAWTRTSMNLEELLASSSQPPNKT